MNLKIQCLSKNEIYQVEDSYNALVQDKKDHLDYFNAHDFINRFELIMQRTINCEQGVSICESEFLRVKHLIVEDDEKTNIIKEV